MGAINIPTIGSISGIPPVILANPIAATPARSMDNIPAAVQTEIEEVKSVFMGKTNHVKDDQTYIKSNFGYFRIYVYDNQNNPADKHTVLFFRNKKSKQIFEIHGTLARHYLGLNRNKEGVVDFPIASDRPQMVERNNQISLLSRYVLLWNAVTNAVSLQSYADYLPKEENKLIAYTEEHDYTDTTIIFQNWKTLIKHVSNAAAWKKSRSFRKIGFPDQILLHETASLGNLGFGGLQMKNSTYFIPHFVVNNIDNTGKGGIVQFTDVAEQIYHGETLNDQSIGIEFVNAPIEAYETKDVKGKQFADLTKPIFKLDKSEKGIYLKTKLQGLGKLFIPLEFNHEKTSHNFKLKIPKDKLINLATLKLGVGKERKTIVEEKGNEVIIKYAASTKFEHLAALVEFLVAKGMTTRITDLSDEKYWQFVIRKGDELLYVFQHAYLKKEISKDDKGNPIHELHFGIDVRNPGIYSHMLSGGHADGGLQGLYLFLKFVKKLSPDLILQTMVDYLTSEKKQIEKDGIVLKTKVIDKQGELNDPKTTMDIKISDLLKID